MIQNSSREFRNQQDNDYERGERDPQIYIPFWMISKRSLPPADCPPQGGKPPEGGDLFIVNASFLIILFVFRLRRGTARSTDVAQCCSRKTKRNGVLGAQYYKQVTLRGLERRDARKSAKTWCGTLFGLTERCDSAVG